MTAPIQEPSTDRALQGFAYARDQIFRRPAPTGVGNMPVFRAAQENVTTTVEAGGIYAEMNYDCWENCAPDIYEEDLDGNILTSLSITEGGVYAITLRFVLDELWTGNFRCILNDYGDWPLAAFFDFNGQLGQNEEAPAVTWVRTYPAIYCLDLGTADINILIQISQFGASGDRDLNVFGSTLEIVQLGSFVPCETS